MILKLSSPLCVISEESVQQNWIDELEDSFLLVYMSGPLIIIHGPRGAAPADPLLIGADPNYNSLITFP
jgi:hypothetical protein